MVPIVGAGVACTLYAYLTPTAIGAQRLQDIPILGGVAGAILGGLPGDFGLYAYRFILITLVFGVLPFAATLAAGYHPRSLGLRLSPLGAARRPFLIFVLVGIVVGIVGGFDPELSSFYPFSKSLVAEVTSGKVGLFVLHVAAYGLLYYLPWEFLFRGVLVLPFVEALEDRVDPGLLLSIASLQVIPSAIMHFGHPFTETLGAVLFGIVAAYFAVRTRSIWPAMVLHLVVGVTVDAVVILRAL